MDKKQMKYDEKMYKKYESHVPNGQKQNMLPKGKLSGCMGMEKKAK